MLRQALRLAPILGLLLVACAKIFGTLPARYYRPTEAGLPAVEKRLEAEQGAGLDVLETAPRQKDFPSTILAAVPLFSKISREIGNTGGEGHGA